MFLELLLDVLCSLWFVLPSFTRKKQFIFNNVWYFVVFFGLAVEIVTSESTNCDYRLGKSPGFINSPNYPKNYPNSKTCSWKIEVPQYDKVLLTFIIFQVDAGSSPSVCDKDFVEIIDGTRSLGKFCNSRNKYPKGTIKSSSNTLTIIFKSDDFTSDGLFHASYEREPCGDFLTGLKGEISSPGYPGPYPASKKCTWRILVPSDKVIKLYFLEFSLDPSSKCNLDFIRVVDGLNTTSQLMGHFCAKRTPPKEIRSTGNEMLLEFQSFKPTLAVGFHAFYETEPHCGGVLKGNMGSFTSPGYPHGALNQKDDQECTWTIEVSKGNIISIVFGAFDVRTSNYNNQCAKDYVEVINGPDIASPSLGRFCGKEPKVPVSMRSSGNNMVIKLHRSTTATGVGFSATYTSLDPKNLYDKCSETLDALLYRCNNGNYIQCQWKCDGTDDCGDKSDESHCTKSVSKSISTSKVRNYVIILVSITSSAVIIALVVFIIDRLRRKRRSQATRRRRRRRARRNHCHEADLREPSSPPPSYDFAVAISDCCDTEGSPPSYTESVTPIVSRGVSEDLPSNQTEISDVERTFPTDQRAGDESGDTTDERIVTNQETTNDMDALSLGESPPSHDTSPLIV